MSDALNYPDLAPPAALTTDLPVEPAISAPPMRVRVYEIAHTFPRQLWAAIAACTVAAGIAVTWPSNPGATAAHPAPAPAQVTPTQVHDCSLDRGDITSLPLDAGPVGVIAALEREFYVTRDADGLFAHTAAAAEIGSHAAVRQAIQKLAPKVHHCVAVQGRSDSHYRVEVKEYQPNQPVHSYLMDFAIDYEMGEYRVAAISEINQRANASPASVVLERSSGIR